MEAPLIGLAMLFACSTAHAGSEAVFVQKAMDDKAIITSRGGVRPLEDFLAEIPSCKVRKARL